MSQRLLCIFLSGLFLLLSCRQTSAPPPLFQLLQKDKTGLDFENVLHQSSAFNVFNYMYFFNGGGVAAGDFNNDGLVDLYFTSNMGPNKLFLNQGGLRFHDVTQAAGVGGSNTDPAQSKGWNSGVSVVDINNDGLLDLYIGQLGEYQGITGHNQLFVCQGIANGVPTYKDEAAAYGLDLVGFATQAVFFDFDADGDLDVFQLNHSLHQNGTFGPRKNFEGKPHALAGDKLLRNDTPAGGKPLFTEVTEQAGIINTVIGYGLGVVAGDVNNDGLPDLYIGNDFHENDYLYINQGNGTFKEVMQEAMMHTSQFSMGVDMADINHDGWTDIFSLDMLPDDPFILKSSLGEDAYQTYQYKIDIGYAHQYTRNCLQLNQGAAFSGKGWSGKFSEIGLLAGVAATDWSWSALFFDYDNDGWQDLFVSNGIPRRMNDIDFVKFQEDRGLSLKEDQRSVAEKDLSVVDKMPKVKLPNRFFRNSGNLGFEDITDRIGSTLTSFSNGAIQADLDNDGDLDVVVNNLEDAPFLYKNLSRESAATTAPRHFLSFEFKGQPGNVHGIGTRVLVFKRGGERLSQEFEPVRGFQSSAHVPLHLGVGDMASVDSVLVIWPDRTVQRLKDLQYDKTQTIAWPSGLPRFDFSVLWKNAAQGVAWNDLTTTSGLRYAHIENPFVEFNREPLIPNMVSTEGPALAVGDVNGDGLEDVFFGSSKRERSALYLQKAGGRFQLATPPAIVADSVFEDVDAVFADLENDGDLDLIIAAGGNEYRGKDEPMKQRAYLNDGHGGFTRADPFPNVFMTASCVLAGDFNGDGLVDFFFGGRAIPWKYGLSPQSYLFQNQGNGQFRDITREAAEGLAEVGLVKSGSWADLDGDGRPDLLLALEWGPVTAFLNRGNGHLEKKELPSGKGWWNTVLAADFDGDGDVDILAGNTGKNSRLQPTAEHPVRLFVDDFDKNGQTETILSYHLHERELPFANFDELTKALPSLKKKFLYAKDFAKAGLPQLFGQDKLDGAVQRQADTFESILLENKGGMNFQSHALPDALQLSTLNAAALAGDLNGDGHPEIVLGGNFYDCNLEMGRYDAFFGASLSIGAGGSMSVAPLGDLRIEGQVRRIRPLKIGGKMALVLARNNASSMVIQSFQ